VKKDTLAANFIFSVGNSGTYHKKSSYAGVNDRDVDKNDSKPFDEILKRLPKFNVLNKKSVKHFTKHILKFK